MVYSPIRGESIKSGAVGSGQKQQSVVQPIPVEALSARPIMKNRTKMSVGKGKAAPLNPTDPNPQQNRSQSVCGFGSPTTFLHNRVPKNHNFTVGLPQDAISKKFDFESRRVGSGGKRNPESRVNQNGRGIVSPPVGNMAY